MGYLLQITMHTALADDHEGNAPRTAQQTAPRDGRHRWVATATPRTTMIKQTGGFDRDQVPSGRADHPDEDHFDAPQRGFSPAVRLPEGTPRRPRALGTPAAPFFTVSTLVCGKTGTCAIIEQNRTLLRNSEYAPSVTNLGSVRKKRQAPWLKMLLNN